MTNIKRFNTPRPPQQGRAYRAPWYDTQQWRTNRTLYIHEHPECEQCLLNNRRGIPSTVVDHIINISSLPEEKREGMFWNQDNWQALCSSCHNSKSGRERR